MGNTLEKPQPQQQAALLDHHHNDKDVDNNSDEDDWFSTSSMGSSSSHFPTTVASAEPPSCSTTMEQHEEGINNNNKSTKSQQINHGVLALQQEQQRQNKKDACWSALWWMKPQQPLWVDIHSSGSSDHHEREEDVVGREEEDDDEPGAGPTPYSQLCNYRYYSSTTSTTADQNPRGMLLWTTSKTLASSPQRHQHLSSHASSSVSSSSSSSLSSSWFADELEYTPRELALSATEPTPVSNLNQPRHVWIVTTAALPWFTGTAVNPLLRAASLWQRYQHMVEEQEQNDKTETDNNSSSSSSSSRFSITLVLPWLHRASDRVALYGSEWQDATVQVQEQYIREWLADRAKMPRAAQCIQIQWYHSHYHPSLSSIFAVDDVCDACLQVPERGGGAVCVLEEPEHLSIYRAPGKTSWGQKFDHVIGIIHTNYKAYCRSHAAGLVTGPLVGALFASLVRAYCDKVIKLSDVLQSYAPEKQVTSNVHGIRQEFLQVGAPSGNKCYFIGKLLFAKGLDKMLMLQRSYKKATGSYFPLDVYGSGPEQEEIKQAFLGKASRRRAFSSTANTTSSSTLSDEDATEDDTESSSSSQQSSSSTKMPVQFLGRVDHAVVSTEYKIFINPSITEVLCTTTSEAIAMGKFVIIPHHSSNTFFAQFPNCLQYSSKYEFCVLLKYALCHTPTPLSDEHRHTLTWEAATDRFFKACAVSERDAARRERISGRQGDERLANLHEDLCKGATGCAVRTILHNGDDPLKPAEQPAAAPLTTSSSSSTSSSWFPTRLHETLNTERP